MSEKTLKFGDIIVNKSKCHASKQAIALNLLDTDKIVVSDNFKHNDNGSKYCFGYLNDDYTIRTLCIILPEMSGYIKYFDHGVKNMSFKIENDDVYLGHIEIWNKIKKTLNISFHSQPIYDEKCKKS